MTVIAEGREAEIVDLGDGTVLRRYRGSGDPEREAWAMRRAGAGGVPVPSVHAVRPDGLVLDRVPGRTLAASLRARPWRLAAGARLLAALHEAVHRLHVPDGALLHLDLHPENVLVGPRGPFLVDWTNWRGGDPALDVALTWVIVETGGAPIGLERRLRRAFLAAFLAHVDRHAAGRALPEAARLRLADPHLLEAERPLVARLVP